MQKHIVHSNNIHLPLFKVGKNQESERLRKNYHIYYHNNNSKLLAVL